MSDQALEDAIARLRALSAALPISDEARQRSEAAMHGLQARIAARTEGDGLDWTGFGNLTLEQKRTIVAETERLDWSEAGDLTDAQRRTIVAAWIENARIGVVLAHPDVLAAALTADGGSISLERAMKSIAARRKNVGYSIRNNVVKQHQTLIVTLAKGKITNEDLSHIQS